jgi:sarcosine oxidase
MRFDYVVVGAGVMGASTAYALSGSGASVALVEQFEVGHKRGSSHGTSRIFRLSYPDARYVDMAQDSLRLWRALESVAGESLLTTTGGFDTGKDLDQHIDALQQCGAAYEIVDGADVAPRWPSLRLRAGEPALFQPDAGIVAADRAVASFARLATERGVTLMDNERVTAFDPGAEGVRVVTSGRDLDAGAVVVTAGAWARGLLADAGIVLDARPTRETVAYWRIEGEPPPTLVDWGAPSVYGLPSPGLGIKVGEHIAGPTTDPDMEVGPDPAAVERLEGWVAERYPGAAARAHHSETCIYTNTPDEHFVLERHGRVVVGSPCSGHGFKFAPLIGKRLGDLAREGEEC